MPGFEYTFVREVPAEFFCPICECTMREPVQTKCGHRFCKQCLEKSMKRKRKCPLDRRPLDDRCATDIYPDVAIERTILDFIVRCPNEGNGCKWTGELRHCVKTHEAACDFIGVKCTNKDCEVTPLKKDLQRHVNNECPKRTIECRYCKTSFVWCMRQGHFDVCKKYPMSCLQKCGEHKIPRDKMDVHIKESCPQTKVDCTYVHVGCKAKVQRRDIVEHVKTNTEFHLKLACEKLQEFQALSTVNTANVTELQAEMFSANKKIEDLSEAVLKSEGLQELRDKIAVTNETLNKLQAKDDRNTLDGLSAIQAEVDALLKEVKELKKDVCYEKKKCLELQDALSYGLRDLRAEATSNKKRLQKVETVNSNLNKAITELWHQIEVLKSDIELKEGETDYKIVNYYQQVCVILNSYHRTLQNFKFSIFVAVIGIPATLIAILFVVGLNSSQ